MYVDFIDEWLIPVPLAFPIRKLFVCVDTVGSVLQLCMIFDNVDEETHTNIADN